MKQNDLNRIIESIKKDPLLMELLYILDELKVPNCYLAAGAVMQTVLQSINDTKYKIVLKDIDIIYFDDSDLSYESENKVIESIKKHVSSDGILLDIKNQARCHLWKSEKYNRDFTPYTSSEDAVKRWIATIHAIGVRIENNELIVYAPYGIDDLMNGIIRPLKHEDTTKELYDQKAKSWMERFPYLKKVEW